MATVKEELKEKQLAISGEQIEDIIKKSVEIDKNTAEIKDIKTTLQEFSGSLDTSELQAKVDKLEADYLKLNDFVVTNAADIASEKVRFNNFRETTKPIEEVTYTKEETDAAITAKVSEIVADAPEDFDTLKEMSDWLTEHSDSAATMNTAIQTNTNDITNLKTAKMNVSDIVTITQAEYDALETKTAPFYFIKEGEATV